MIIIFKSNDPSSRSVYILYFWWSFEIRFNNRNPPNYQRKWSTWIIECMHPSIGQRLIEFLKDIAARDFLLMFI